MGRKVEDELADTATSHPDSGTGDCEAPDESLEAPKRPRSAAQIAAFERARAKRDENRKAKAKAPEPEPEKVKPKAKAKAQGKAKEPEPEPETPKAPSRKHRSDKGKKRGYLVRGERAPARVDAYNEPEITVRYV